jgi:hypothetical protein
MVYTIKGKIHWAKLHPETAQEDKYMLDLQLLDEKSVAFCKQAGLKIKQAEKDGDTRGTFISLWTYMKDFDGQVKQFNVVDAELKPVAQYIGNGTVGIVEFKIKDWEYKGKRGKRAELMAVQVEELVTYAGKPGSSFKPLTKGSAPSPQLSDNQVYETIGDEAVA